jgi:hypothetical protein
VHIVIHCHKSVHTLLQVPRLANQFSWMAALICNIRYVAVQTSASLSGTVSCSPVCTLPVHKLFMNSHKIGAFGPQESSNSTCSFMIYAFIMAVILNDHSIWAAVLIPVDCSHKYVYYGRRKWLSAWAMSQRGRGRGNKMAKTLSEHVYCNITFSPLEFWCC